MKLIGLVLSCLLLAAPASAITLTLTEGEFDLFHFDSYLRASGSGVTLFSTAPLGGDLLRAGGLLGMVDYPLGYSGVYVNGSAFCVGDCGRLTFLSFPLELPPPGSFGQFLSPSVPFVMIGHVSVGAGFDVIGSGTVDRLDCIADLTGLCAPGQIGSFGTPLYRYHFASVPEPGSGALVVAGGLAMLTLLVVARRARR
jgi:hypothetical protein